MDDAAAAITAWGLDATLEPVGDGLINRTWRARTPAGVVGFLQELNTRIFRAEVHEDIEAVTTALAEAGVPTPRLVRTRADGLWHVDAGGAVWRLLTPVGDRTVHRVERLDEAESAGRLVARFHAATRDLEWSFRMVRPGAHHTPTHVGRLLAALEAHRDHRLWSAVSAVTEGIASAWARWSGPDRLPERVIHGDLKISNVRFAGEEAHALVDLDTLARGTLEVELGDMLRSWCNRASEDCETPVFDAAVFTAALAGYRERAEGVGPEEWAAIVPGVERIALELAARFAADALNESYFGWNPRFGGRGEHNLLRARGQLALAASVAAQRAALERVVARG